MRLANFAKLTAEERDAAWAAMDNNRRNALVGEALGYRVVAHSWPCFLHQDECDPYPEQILPLSFYHNVGPDIQLPVYVPSDVPDADWPPSVVSPDDAPQHRRCDLEVLPDFVGDMGAAYEIIGWLRKNKLMCWLETALRDSGGLRYQDRSLSIGNDYWWYVADWPEVLGRAVVEAVLEAARKEREEK